MIFYSSADFKPFFPRGKRGLDRDLGNTDPSQKGGIYYGGGFFGNPDERQGDTGLMVCREQ
jgi:hypothetical protein